MAKTSLSQDEIALSVVVDGNQSRKALAEVTQDVVKLRQEQKGLELQAKELKRQLNITKKDTAEYKVLESTLRDVQAQFHSVTQAIESQGARQSELRQQMGISALSLKELRAEAAKLEAQLKVMVPDTPEAVELERQLLAIKERVGEVGGAVAREIRVWESLRKELTLQTMTVKQLGLEEKRLKEILANPATGAEERGEAVNQLKAVQDRMEQLTSVNRAAADAWEVQRKNIALVDMTLEQLNLEQQRYKQIQQTADPNSAAYAEAVAGLEAVKDRQDQLTNSTRRTKDAWEEQRKGIALVDMTLEQLEQELKRYQQIQNTNKPDSEAYREAAAGMAQVEDRIAQLTNANRIAADAWEQQRKSIALVDMTLEQLELETKRYQQIQASARPDSTEYAEAVAGIEAVKNRTEELTNTNRRAELEWEKQRKSIRLVDMSMEQLELELKALRAEQARLNPNAQAKEFQTLGKSILGVEDRIKVLGNNLTPFQRLWRNVKQEMSGVVGIAAGLFGVNMIGQGIKSLITGAGEISDQLANVRRVSGLTQEQVRDLNSELAGLETRTATEGLRQIAIGLGQAGQAVNAVNVAAVDKIVLALGDEFGDNATEIANVLTVLRNNLGDIKTGNFGQDIEFIGNALNELGAKGLATAPVVTDIANRIAGVARTFGVTSGEILGTAATFQELGVNTERGSTAYIKILQRMAAEPAKFAAVVQQAGLDATQFSQDLNTNMQAAFITIARAAQLAGKDNKEFASILKELDVDGAGVSELLSKIGVNYGLLTEKTDLATASLKTNASIAEEARLRNETLGAQIDLLSKDFNRLLASRTLTDFFTDLVGVARETVQWIARNRDAIVFFAKVITTAAIAWGTYRLGAIASAAATRLMTAAGALWARAQAVIAGNTIAAARAQVAFNTAVKSNPIGLVLSVLSTAAALYLSFGQEVQAATEKQEAFNNKVQEGMGVLRRMQDLEQQGSVVDQLSKQQLLDRRANLQQALTDLESYRGQVLASEDQATADLRARLQTRNDELAKLRAASQSTENEQQKAALRDRATELLREIDSLNSRIRSRTRQAGVEINAEEAAAQKKSLEQQLAATDAAITNIQLEGDAKIRTIAEIDAEIAAKQEAQKASSDKTTFDKIGAEIRALERERDAITGATQGNKEKQTGDHLKQLEQQIADFRQRLHEGTLSEDERELEQLREKHRKEIDEVRRQQAELIAAGRLSAPEAEADLATFSAQQQQEEILLIEQQGEKRLAAYKENDDKITAALREGASQHLAARLSGIEAEIALAQSAGGSTVELERRRKDILLQIYKDNAQNAIQEEVRKWRVIIDLAKAQRDKAGEQLQTAGLETTPDEYAAQAAEYDALNQTVLDGELALDQAISAINTDRRNSEMAAEQGYTSFLSEEQRKRLEGQVQMWQGYGQALSGLDQLFQQFHANENERGWADTAAAKVIGLAQIAINAATAISGAVSASTAGDPYTFAARVAIAIGAVAAGIAQAYSMFSKSNTGQTAPASTPSLQPDLIQMPTGAEGGPIAHGNFIPASSGTLDGPSHNDGGLGVFNLQTGRQVAEFEGGEHYMLFSKAFTQANSDQLGQLLSASRTGARLNLLDRPVRAPNPARVRQAVMPLFAQGGMFGDLQGANNPTGTVYTFTKATSAASPGSGGSGGGNDEMIDLLRQIVAGFGNMPKSIKAHVALNPEYDRTHENWEDIKAGTRIAPTRR